MASMARFQESDRSQHDNDSPSSKHNANDLNQSQLIAKLERDYELSKRVKVPGFFQSILDKYKAPKKYKLLNKFQTQLEKELDLEKIIRRIRLLVFSAMGILTADQSVFVDTMSRMIVRESSDFKETSSDEELGE